MPTMTMIEAIRDAHAIAMERDERVVVQSFTSAPYLLQHTDLVFTTTRHFARFYAEMDRNRARLRAAREEVATGAISGAVGTFRTSFMFDWFSASNFLCNPGNTTLAGTPITCNRANTGDHASHVGAFFALNVTPLPFLEAYAAIRTYANSDDQGKPQLLQLLSMLLVRHSLDRGNSAGSALGYASYGMRLGGAMGDYVTAQEVGLAGLALLAPPSAPLRTSAPSSASSSSHGPVTSTPTPARSTRTPPSSAEAWGTSRPSSPEPWPDLSRGARDRSSPWRQLASPEQASATLLLTSRSTGIS